MTTSESSTSRKRFSEKLHEYLLEEPKVCDVTFLVGPTKEVIRALRVILVVASPIFRKLFEEKWDHGIEKEGDAIPLPNVDSKVFKLFLQLLPCDRIGIQDLVKLEITSNQIFDLELLAKQFNVEVLQDACHGQIQLLIHQFGFFANTPDFLTLSCQNLASLLSSEEIVLNEVEIFEHVCRWAENKCSELELAINAENMRFVLGDCLNKIKFNLMNYKEVGTIVYKKNILTKEELLKAFLSVINDNENRSSFDSVSLGLKSSSSNMSISSAKRLSVKDIPVQTWERPDSVTVCLHDPLVFSASSPFMCSGSELWDSFNVDKSIELLGIGFAGPLNSDGDYTVLIEPQLLIKDEWTSMHGRTAQFVEGKVGQPLHVMFAKPFICPLHDQTVSCSVRIQYSFVKGKPLQKVAQDQEESVNGNETTHFTRKADDVTFKFTLHDKQIVELRFKKMEFYPFLF